MADAHHGRAAAFLDLGDQAANLGLADVESGDQSLARRQSRLAHRSSCFLFEFP
jgi:hypothetical protein